MSEKIVYSVKLPKELIEAFKKKLKQNHQTSTGVVSSLITKFLKSK